MTPSPRVGWTKCANACPAISSMSSEVRPPWVHPGCPAVRVPVQATASRAAARRPRPPSAAGGGTRPTRGADRGWNLRRAPGGCAWVNRRLASTCRGRPGSAGADGRRGTRSTTRWARPRRRTRPEAARDAGWSSRAGATSAATTTTTMMMGGATRAEGDAAPSRAPRAIACIRSNTRRQPGRNIRARGRGSQTTAAKEFGARPIHSDVWFVFSQGTRYHLQLSAHRMRHEERLSHAHAHARAQIRRAPAPGRPDVPSPEPPRPAGHRRPAAVAPEPAPSPPPPAPRLGKPPPS